MRQTRNGVFETNSSSVHSICISKEPIEKFPDSIHFYLGEYGWGFDTVEPAYYLYTAIMCIYDSPERDIKLNQLKSMLDNHSISYTFEEPIYYSGMYGTWIDNAGIDHDYEARDFVEAVLANDDLLMRCLFGPNSVVYTGNDNSDEYNNMCWAADEYTYDDDFNEIPNPNHDETKFDYFYKGN